MLQHLLKQFLPRAKQTFIMLNKCWRTLIPECRPTFYSGEMRNEWITFRIFRRMFPFDMLKETPFLSFYTLFKVIRGSGNWTVNRTSSCTKWMEYEKEKSTRSIWEVSKISIIPLNCMILKLFRIVCFLNTWRFNGIFLEFEAVVTATTAAIKRVNTYLK